MAKETVKSGLREILYVVLGICAMLCFATTLDQWLAFAILAVTWFKLGKLAEKLDTMIEEIRGNVGDIAERVSETVAKDKQKEEIAAAIFNQTGIGSGSGQKK